MWDRFRIDKKLDIDRKYINIGVVAVITGIALFIGYEIVSRSGTFITIFKDAILGFLSVIRPIIIGAIISYLLFPLVRRIEIFIKKCVSVKGNNKFNWIYRIISIILVFFIIILSVVLIFNFIIPPLLENAKSLINNIPQYESIVRNGINNLNSYFATLDINYQQISTYIDKVTAAFAVIGQEIVNIITNSIYGFGSFMIDFVLSIIFTFYFLKDKEMLFKTIRRFGRAFIPGKLGTVLKQFIIDLDEVVGGFVRGVLLDALIVGIVSSILMLMIHHPFAVLVGVIAGICNVIPYVGPAIGAVVAFVLGIFSSITLGIWGFILLILYQQVDGNIIQPKIVGGSVGLPAVWTLIALTIGGGYAGAVGMIVAVPTAAILSVYVHRIYKKKLII
ncbi:AI-2E family transporter [Clostridium sp. UBA7503]|uniref:AI-2E family transporter n=1 Tax=Clostridium sp. UBA7503 TaxID=1946377 RepID=UPI00321724B7